MLSGNICRCTGYTGLVKAVLEVDASEGHGQVTTPCEDDDRRAASSAARTSGC